MSSTTLLYTEAATLFAPVPNTISLNVVVAISITVPSQVAILLMVIAVVIPVNVPVKNAETIPSLAEIEKATVLSKYQLQYQR